MEMLVEMDMTQNMVVVVVEPVKLEVTRVWLAGEKEEMELTYLVISEKM
jgi:hypothetical protein